ncbi:MAG: M23 family metallopeptidase [Candidatus Rokubacteria bacterium]|nr:M23 family metallopeptidase [Candidatus Rokubacteria bacterium]
MRAGPVRARRALTLTRLHLSVLRRVTLLVLSVLLAAVSTLGPALAAAPSAPGKPVPRRSPSLAAKPAKDDRRARATPAPECSHLVRAGETASQIARRQRVRQDRLLEANGLKRSSVLRIGQRLRVPGCEPTRVARRGPAPAQVLDGPLVLALVGARRIPTRLYLAVPEFRDGVIGLAWPVVGPVISLFGERVYGWHAGIDITAEAGTPILAAAPGTVVFSGSEGTYGRVIKIDHAGGLRTIYAHNLQNVVEVGDWVEGGTFIGTVGRTGRATGYHLHFEVRRDDVAYNPLFLLAPRDQVTTLTEATLAPEVAEDEDVEEEPPLAEVGEPGR